MKNLATAYTYNPTAKTITLTGLNVPLSYLLLIVNATRGTIIYNLADPSLAAAAYTQAANSILTLNASVSTTFHDPSDSLTIFYDDGVQTSTVLIQGPAGPKGDKGDPGNDGADGQDGADGLNGTNGVDGADGTDGREVELQKSATHLQWRYLGDNIWTDLVPLSELKGDKGDPGSTEISGITGLQAALDGKSDLLQPVVIDALSQNLVIPSARNQFYKITQNTFASYTATLPQANVKTGDKIVFEFYSNVGRSLPILHAGNTLHTIGNGENLVLIAQSNGASWIVQQGITRHAHAIFYTPQFSGDQSIAGFVPGGQFSDRGKFLRAGGVGGNPWKALEISDTTGLQDALDAKASTSALAALEARVAALEAAQAP